MSHIDDLLKIKEAQEKEVKVTISGLEAERASLDETKEQNQDKIDKVNEKIVDAYSQLSEIQEEKNSLENDRKNERHELIHENIILPFKETAQELSELAAKITDKTPEIATGLAEIILDQSGYTSMVQNATEIALREFSAQNQVVVEQVIDSNRDQINNPIKETQSLENVVKEEYKELNNNIINAPAIAEITSVEKTKTEIKWKNEIDNKESLLIESHQKQLDALKKNEAVLQIQQEDAKKFPDAEKKLQQLKPLEELLKNEERKLENKFQERLEDINKEKQVLQKVVENTMELKEADREKAIQEQRLAFELARQKQLEELNRTR